MPLLSESIFHGFSRLEWIGRPFGRTYRQARFALPRPLMYPYADANPAGDFLLVAGADCKSNCFYHLLVKCPEYEVNTNSGCFGGVPIVAAFGWLSHLLRACSVWANVSQTRTSRMNSVCGWAEHAFTNTTLPSPSKDMNSSM